MNNQQQEQPTPMQNLKIEQALQAGMLRRFAILVYDFMLVIGLWFFGTAIALVFIPQEQAFKGSIAYQFFLLALWLAYYTLSLTRSGQTVGMRAWKVKVVDEHFRLIRLGPCVVRFFTALGGLAYLTCLFSKQKRALNDITSGSYLVRINHPATSKQ